MTDADDPNRLPTDQEMNSAVFVIVTEIYHRADVTMRLLDCLADYRRLPLLDTIARDVGVPLSDFCAAFAAEVLRRTGIHIAPVGMVPLATKQDTVH